MGAWNVRAIVAAVLSVALLPFAVLTEPATARASSPFCAATLWLVPWNASSDAAATSAESADYALFLNAAGKTDVAARVTLITDAEAFAVTVPRVALHAIEKESDRVASAHVRFDRKQPVRYAFVDAVGVDGADLTDCPSDVSEVEPYRGDASSWHVGDALSIAPKLLQPLPKLACAKAYVPAHIIREIGAPVGHFGNTPRSTGVHVYVDSDGRVVKADVAESSGVEGLDIAALALVRNATYAPAQFLCTPVVSDFIIRMDYSTN